MPLTGLIGQTRALYVDVDPVDPAHDDSVITARLNENYLLYSLKVEKRVTPQTATQSGFSLTVANAGIAESTPLNWYEVVEAYRAASAATAYGTPIEIVKVQDVLRLRASDPTPGIPAKIAFTRLASASSANIGKWTAYAYPIPDQTYYAGTLVRAWPTELASAADTPDLTELAAYTIARIAAAQLAAAVGEDETFIRHILAPIPDETLELMGMPRPGFRAPAEEERAA